ncbi:MAG: radical SAM protein [Desulfobulbaceae bacterium]|nr:radical SAM protein [Desulfobulbaceae bacterium]
MRILLVNPNREVSPFPVAPIGALFVASAARRAGHHVDFLDLTFKVFPKASLKKRLAGKGYDLAALSIRNLDNCAYCSPRSYIDEIRTFAEVIRENSLIPLVLGGSGFSLAPEKWLDALDAQFGVVGEGDTAFPALLAKIEAGDDPGMLPGVVCRGSDRKAEPLKHAADLDGLSSPAHALCNYAQYIRKGGFVGLQSKRGCPFDCIYCVYSQLEGKRYRLRSPQILADEINQVLKDSKARHFFFTDSVFNSPREHALQVCEEIVRRKLPVQWMAYCNPVGFDRELAEMMARSGCIGVEFGLDAATDRMLAAMGKPFTQAEIFRSMTAARQASIPFAVHLLFGGPGEGTDDIVAAQEFLNTCPTAHAVFASIGIRIYENTSLAATALQEKVISEQTDFFLPTYYVSGKLGIDPVANLDGIVRRRPEWSSPVDWNKPLLRGIQQIVNLSGQRPQWKNISNYGRHMRKP